MRLREEVIGALNLFSTRPRRLSTQDLTVGRVLADAATIVILQYPAVVPGHSADSRALLHPARPAAPAGETGTCWKTRPLPLQAR